METPNKKTYSEVAKEANDALSDVYVQLKEKVDFNDCPEFDKKCEELKKRLEELSEISFINMQLVEDKITFILQFLKETTRHLYAYLRTKRIIFKSKETFDPAVLNLAEEFGKLSLLFDDVDLKGRESRKGEEQEEASAEEQEVEYVDKTEHKIIVADLKAQIRKFKYALWIIIAGVSISTSAGIYFVSNNIARLQREKHNIGEKLINCKQARKHCVGNQNVTDKITSNLRKRVNLLERREWDRIRKTVKDGGKK